MLYQNKHNDCPQYLPSIRELEAVGLGVLGGAAGIQRRGVLGGGGVLRPHVLRHPRRPGQRGCADTFRHDRRQAHGPPSLHRLRLLGTDRLLWRHGTRRLSTHRRIQH